mmetsp:Transcript_25815/g.81989  ORF Transcript_25815/g.81989 Transcript_25815/m.81989 type:complete len:470 (-) Transcript_25815:65-1474(-)
MAWSSAVCACIRPPFSPGSSAGNVPAVRHLSMASSSTACVELANQPASLPSLKKRKRGRSSSLARLNMGLPLWEPQSRKEPLAPAEPETSTAMTASSLRLRPLMSRATSLGKAVASAAGPSASRSAARSWLRGPSGSAAKAALTWTSARPRAFICPPRWPRSVKGRELAEVLHSSWHSPVPRGSRATHQAAGARKCKNRGSSAASKRRYMGRAPCEPQRRNRPLQRSESSTSSAAGASLPTASCFVGEAASVSSSDVSLMLCTGFLSFSCFALLFLIFFSFFAVSSFSLSCLLLWLLLCSRRFGRLRFFSAFLRLAFSLALRLRSSLSLALLELRRRFACLRRLSRAFLARSFSSRFRLSSLVSFLRRLRSPELDVALELSFPRFAFPRLRFSTSVWSLLVSSTTFFRAFACFFRSSAFFFAERSSAFLRCLSRSSSSSSSRRFRAASSASSRIFCTSSSSRWRCSRLA